MDTITGKMSMKYSFIFALNYIFFSLHSQVNTPPKKSVKKKKKKNPCQEFEKSLPTQIPLILVFKWKTLVFISVP